MTITDIRVIWQKHRFKILIPSLLAALAVLFFLQRKPALYKSESVLFTGIASSYQIAGDNNVTGKNIRPEMAIADILILLDSRETKKEVIFSLLAQHIMMNGYNPALISNENYDRFKKLLKPEVRSHLRAGSFAETYNKVASFYESGSTNAVRKLVHSSDPIYSLKAMGNISVFQMNSSEMIQIEYESNDPAVSQQTLVFLNDIFLRKHQSLFASQANSVINYFDSSVRQSYARLQAAEQALLDFNKQHGILDYDHQVLAASENKVLSGNSLNDVRVQYSGAAATLRAAESHLKKRGRSQLESQEIIRLRDQLAKVNADINTIEMMGTSADANDKRKLASLRQTAGQLESRLNQTVDNHYNNSTVSYGMPVDELVDDYVKNSLEAAQLRSQLGALSQQKAQATGEASKLVPLGPEIRRIKREIELAQQDYLAQVEGLKQSKLSQENMQLANNQVKVVDPPNYPLKPTNQAQIPLLVILAFMGTLLFLLSLLVAHFIIDKALRSPERATALTGLPLMGVMPGARMAGPHEAVVRQQAIRQLAKHVMVQFNTRKSDTPFIVAITSHYAGEGKTAMAEQLQRHLNLAGIHTSYLVPDQHPASGEARNYILRRGINKEALKGSAEIVLVETPSVLSSTFPVSVLKQADYNLLVAKYGRSWQPADQQAVEDVRALNTAPVGLVLSEAPELYVEEFSGTVGASGRVTVLPNDETSGGRAALRGIR